MARSVGGRRMTRRIGRSPHRSWLNRAAETWWENWPGFRNGSRNTHRRRRSILVPESKTGSATATDTPTATPGHVNGNMEASARAVIARLQAERQQNPTLGQERAAREAGRKAARLKAALHRAGVRPRYQEATWDQVANADDYAEWRTPLVLQAKIRYGRGLILLGPVGTGKSSAAACIAREVLQLEQRGTVRWEYFPSMLDELETREGRLRVQDRQRQLGLVVWDDVGVEKLAE